MDHLFDIQVSRYLVTDNGDIPRIEEFKHMLTEPLKLEGLVPNDEWMFMLADLPYPLKSLKTEKLEPKYNVCDLTGLNAPCYKVCILG